MDRKSTPEERRETIKARLASAGYSLSGLDTLYKLPRGTAQRTLDMPHAKGEKVIAAALDVKASLLWSDRYDPSTGQRLCPQPRINYVRPLPVAQRRNVAGALA